MPANLTPQYYEAEKKYRSARTPLEKMDALEEMMRVMPKHKGTDHLRADLRRRMAQVNDEMESAAKKGHGFRIRREGAGQIVMAGLTNTGKSRLLRALTEATPDVGSYPFVTLAVMPGMMRFENVQIQLIDTPAINSRDARVSVQGLLRTGDGILLVVDLGNDPVRQLDETLVILQEFKIVPGREAGVPEEGILGKPLLVVGNKSDLPHAAINYERLLARCCNLASVVSVSAETGAGLDELRQQVFLMLNVIRVYTKPRSGKPDLSDPVLLQTGKTVQDFAMAVHKDFHARMKYANIWGSGKFDGQRVSRDHQLQDGDIVELHI